MHGDPSRIDAIDGVAVGMDRHLGDDRQIGRVAAAEDRLLDLRQVAEGLDDEQVDPALGQRLGLLLEESPRFLASRGPVGLDPDTEGTERAGDEQVVARHTPRQLGARPVDLAHAIREPEVLQPQAVGTEGVGLEDLGAGVSVGTVNFAHDLGTLEVELVIANVDEHAAAIQLGSDRTIEQVRAAVLDHGSKVRHRKSSRCAGPGGGTPEGLSKKRTRPEPSESAGREDFSWRLS